MTIRSAQVTDKSEQALILLPLGRSEAMRRVHEQIRRLASTDTPTLIYGETRTGKELVATALHRLSRRASGPYLCVNCGGLPDGLVESELFSHVRGRLPGHSRNAPDDSRPRTVVPFSRRDRRHLARGADPAPAGSGDQVRRTGRQPSCARSMFASLPQRTNPSGTKWALDDFAGTFTIASTPLWAADIAADREKRRNAFA